MFNVRKLIFYIYRLFNEADACSFYLKKYLYIAKNIAKGFDFEKKLEPSNYVWTMWLQGMENAPEIVKVCVQSIQKYYPQVTIITENNFRDYVDIPEKIYQKYRDGIISYAHFSDLIRICLLDKYGGIWIDATCYLTNYIPEYATNSNFFMLRSFKALRTSNYFIISRKGAFITKVIKEFLIKYWKEENFTLIYGFYHKMFRLLLQRNKTFLKEFQNSPRGVNITTKILYLDLFKDYNPKYFEYLKNMSYLHKLTYKEFDKNNTNENSLYRHLLAEYKKEQEAVEQ